MSKFLSLISFLFLAFMVGLPESHAALFCTDIHTDGAKQTRFFFEDQGHAEKALEIMMEGSLNVSRTKASGRRFLAPAEVKDAQIAAIAERNFKKAAQYILMNFKDLEINLETAVLLNRMLTQNLVPENIRGKFDYRQSGTYVGQIDHYIGRFPRDFYVNWLNSSEAKALHKNSPVEFAEILHNTVMSLDSFPDGNGRLSRLLADLALIKSNISPAYYTSMADYFDRGNSRSAVSREVRKSYFREIVKKGMSVFRIPLSWLPVRQQQEQFFAAAA